MTSDKKAYHSTPLHLGCLLVSGDYKIPACKCR